MYIECSCGYVFRRKKHARNLHAMFSRGAHAGHHEVKRWTYIREVRF